MNQIARRYDLDMLRVIAIILLMIYHTALFFTSFAKYIFFIQNDEPLEWLWNLMSILNVWRIPLLFFVSGMGVYFAFKKRNWKQLLKERSKRILIPFLFGSFIIVPIYLIQFSNYYNIKYSYFPSPGHLWFLGNLIVYVFLTLPFLLYLKKRSEHVLVVKFRRLLEKCQYFVFVLAVPYVAVAFFTPNTVAYSSYSLTGHGFRVGLISFLLGFFILIIGDHFWKVIAHLKWLCVIIAFILYLARVYYFDFQTAHWLTATESINWIFAVFGFSYSYLNRPFKHIKYLSRSVLPIYIIHMPVMYLGAILVIPLNISSVIKFILITVFTILGCFFIYEYIIRRIRFLHICFGMAR